MPTTMTPKIIAWLVGVVIAVLGVWFYGHERYNAGVAFEKAEVATAQKKLETDWQEKVDAADKKYRDLAAARAAADQAQQVELDAATVAVSNAHRDADSLAGLLDTYASRAKSAPAVSGSHGAGPDFIGILGQCFARVDSLAGSLAGSTDRLGQVASTAAGWADKLNGFQGYALGLQKK